MTNIYRRIMDTVSDTHVDERMSSLLCLLDSVQGDAERVAVLCRIVTELATDLKRCQRMIDSANENRQCAKEPSLAAAEHLRGGGQ
jgi:hypothetical protein